MNTALKHEQQHELLTNVKQKKGQRLHSAVQFHAWNLLPSIIYIINYYLMELYSLFSHFPK